MFSRHNFSRAGVTSVALGAGALGLLPLGMLSAGDAATPVVSPLRDTAQRPEARRYQRFGIAFEGVLPAEAAQKQLFAAIEEYDSAAWRNIRATNAKDRVEEFIDQALTVAPLSMDGGALSKIAHCVASVAAQTQSSESTSKKLYVLLTGASSSSEARGFYLGCLRELHALNGEGARSALLLIALQHNDSEVFSAAIDSLSQGRPEVQEWLVARRNQQSRLSPQQRALWNQDMASIVAQGDGMNASPEFAARLKTLYAEIEKVREALNKAVEDFDRAKVEAERANQILNKLHHRVNFVTVALRISDLKNAGTDANFYVEFRQGGARMRVNLPNQKGNDCERGKTTTYDRLGLPSPISSLEPYTVVLGHDNSGDKPGCHVAEMRLTLHTEGAGDDSRSYGIDRWLASDEAGGLTVSVEDSAGRCNQK